MYSDFAISDGSGQGGKVPDYLETVVAGKGITTTTVSAQPTQLQPNSLQPAVTCAVQQPQTVIQPAFSMAGTGQHLICFKKHFLQSFTKFRQMASLSQYVFLHRHFDSTAAADRLTNSWVQHGGVGGYWQLPHSGTAADHPAADAAAADPGRQDGDVREPSAEHASNQTHSDPDQSDGDCSHHHPPAGQAHDADLRIHVLRCVVGCTMNEILTALS